VVRRRTSTTAWSEGCLPQCGQKKASTAVFRKKRIVKMVMYDGCSPGIKRLRHRFSPTGFPVRCMLVSQDRRNGGEEFHDVSLGVFELQEDLG